MPAVSNVKYQQVIGDYTFTFWFGEEFDFSTPTTVTLDDDVIKSFEFSGENSDPMGLHTANSLKISIDVAVFNLTLREAFIDGTITNTTGLILDTISGGIFNGKTFDIDDFIYYNSIQVEKNGVVIFYGVQDIQDEVSVDGDFMDLEYTCIISKALQILPLKYFKTLGAGSYSYIYMYMYNLTGSNYNDTILGFWNMDNYYTDGGSVRGVINIDDKYRGITYFNYTMTFKYLFELVSSWCSTMISKWLRASNTFTLDNPFNHIKFYKLSATNDFLKSTQLTEDEIRFNYKLSDYDMFGETSVLNYDSWFEFLRDLTPSLFLRSKVDYDNLELNHYPILDNTDEVEFNEEVKLEGNPILYKWKWNEINNTFNSSNRMTFERGQPFPNDEITLTKRSNGSGNLKRLELKTYFHNVPISSSNHRYRKTWLASDNNIGAIGYITNFSIDGAIESVFIRCHDVVSIKRNATDYYEPTNKVNTVSLPDAKDRAVSPSGAKVANEYYNWRALRVTDTTLPTEINHLIWAYLRGGSVTFEFTTDQDIDINSINSFCSFSDYTFLPNYLQSFNTKGIITKISKSSENDLVRVEVTIAN